MAVLVVVVVVLVIVVRLMELPVARRKKKIPTRTFEKAMVKITMKKLGK